MDERQLRRRFNDQPTRGRPGVDDVPRDLADSPTVNDPDAAISPAAQARASVPAAPGAGMKEDYLDNPVPVENPAPGQILTERSPTVDPGAPLNPKLGWAVDDQLGPLNQSSIGDRIPGSETLQLPDHGEGMPGHPGAEVGFDETTGTSDPSAEAAQQITKVKE